MKIKMRVFVLYMFFLNFFLSLLSGTVFAEDKTSMSFVAEKSEKREAGDFKDLKEKGSLMNNGFVFETNDESASESLERVSGKIDMGFSAPENSYKSGDQYAPGPFSKEKAEVNKQSDPADY